MLLFVVAARGVVGTGKYDGLPCGGLERLDQSALVRGIVKHLAVQGQRLQAVLLRHKSEKPPQFVQKLLPVDSCHLHKGIGCRARIIVIIAGLRVKVKKILWKRARFVY